MTRLLLTGLLLLCALPQRVTLEQRVYLRKCTGGWYVSEQGTQDESDWVELKCQDGSDDPATP